MMIEAIEARDIRDMRQAKQGAIYTLLRFRVTLLLVLLLGLVYYALEASIDYQSAPILHWMMIKIEELIGLRIPPVMWKAGFGIGALLIAVFRPKPIYAYGLCFTLIVYGFFAVWYGLATNIIPYTVLILMAWGYACTPIMIAVLTAFGDAAADNAVLQEELKALKDEIRVLKVEHGADVTDSNAPGK